MRRQELILATIAALAFLSAQPLIACGESLFRVGKGVAYREYTAPLPGNIIVVAHTETELAFVQQLSAAGHQITVVESAQELRKLNEYGDVDIVIARYADRETVNDYVDQNQVSFLPVSQKGSDEVGAAKAAYANYLVSDDSLKKFLKTIHKTLKNRQV